MGKKSLPGFAIATRQKADVLFGPLARALGASVSQVLPVRRVAGYARVNFLGISAATFTILVEEANEAEGPFAQITTLTSALDPVTGLQRICERLAPCGTFMRLTVTNTGATRSAISLLVNGLPHASSGVGGGGDGDGADISAKVTNSADQPIPDMAPTSITFDTVIYDTNGMFDPLFPTILTIQEDGKYDIFGALMWSPGGGTFRTAVLIQNSLNTLAITDVAPIPGSFTGQQVYAPGVQLSAGDTVELLVLQDSGAPIDSVTGGGASPILYAKKVN